MKLWRITKLLVIGISLVITPSALSADTLTAFGANDSGLVVGEDSNGQGYVFNLNNGAFMNISFPGATSTAAYGINNSGQIVGTYTTSLGQFGFLDSGGTFTTLGVAGAYQVLPPALGSSGTSASGINSAGEIVGNWESSSGVNQGYTYSGGTFTDTSISNSATFTELYGINDNGLISGYTYSGGVRSGFVYNGTTFMAINYPGAAQTIVQGINNSGEVVGTYIIGGVGQGFMYSTATGTFTSIVYPGSSSTQVFGINNNGVIVGDYTCSSGECPFSDPAFFATPTSDGYSFTTIDAPTPEPRSVFLVGAGCLTMLGALRRGARHKRSGRPALSSEGRRGSRITAR